jgi:hypothetical protein
VGVELLVGVSDARGGATLRDGAGVATAGVVRVGVGSSLLPMAALTVPMAVHNTTERPPTSKMPLTPERLRPALGGIVLCGPI